MTRTLAPVVLALLAAGGGGSAQPAVPADRDGVTRLPLLPPRPGNPRNSEGAFIELKGGRVLFVYTHFTGGAADHAASHLASRSSDDGGRTWSDRDAVVVPNEGQLNTMSVSLVRLAGGRIGLFYLVRNAPDDLLLYVRLSTTRRRRGGRRRCARPSPGTTSSTTTASSRRRPAGSSSRARAAPSRAASPNPASPCASCRTTAARRGARAGRSCARRRRAGRGCRSRAWCSSRTAG